MYESQLRIVHAFHFQLVAVSLSLSRWRRKDSRQRARPNDLLYTLYFLLFFFHSFSFQYPYALYAWFPRVTNMLLLDNNNNNLHFVWMVCNLRENYTNSLWFYFLESRERSVLFCARAKMKKKAEMTTRERLSPIKLGLIIASFDCEPNCSEIKIVDTQNWCTMANFHCKENGTIEFGLRPIKCHEAEIRFIACRREPRTEPLEEGSICFFAPCMQPNEQCRKKQTEHENE